MLEEAGLGRLLTELKDTTGPAVFEAMLRKLTNFSGTQDFPDDVSGVLFEYHGPN
jgi:sigma-B regulation protein RsbU (phosphoserine phosphatase)